MGDIFGQIGAEQDVHRSADAHLAFKGQIFALGHQRIAAVCPNQKFGSDGDFFARQAIKAGRGYAIGILAMAQILGGHTGLRAARAGRFEQKRFHKCLWQVIHECRR